MEAIHPTVYPSTGVMVWKVGVHTRVHKQLVVIEVMPFKPMLLGLRS